MSAELKKPIGPFPKDRIVLCSADAGPGSQRDYSCEAAYFFPEAKWVGAVRNIAEKLGYRFVILTTGHGMVNPWDTIDPYDKHINEYPREVNEKWIETIPKILGSDQYDILVFYPGGCPRDLYIELMMPILNSINISLITFGRPNMYDINKLPDVIKFLVSGTNNDELKSILKCPEWLEYYPAREKYELNRTVLNKRSHRLKDKNVSQSKIKILFNDSGKPYKADFISDSISNFGKSYNETVSAVIRNTERGLSKRVFCENIARLMPPFKMTRRGPFKGVKFTNGQVEDPAGIIEKCWVEVGDDVVELRDLLDRKSRKNRSRVLIELPGESQKEVTNRLWNIFKKLLPVCKGKITPGRVGASKVLFAIFPEVALPVDNKQWKSLSKTIDYREIISKMITEIIEWEDAVGKELNSCSPIDNFTLPAIYNVMAMRARP